MNNNQRPTDRSGVNSGAFRQNNPPGNNNGAPRSGTQTQNIPRQGMQTQNIPRQGMPPQNLGAQMRNPGNAQPGQNRQPGYNPTARGGNTAQGRAPTGTVNINGQNGQGTPQNRAPGAQGRRAANQTQPKKQAKPQTRVKLTPEQKEKARKDRQRERHQIMKSFTTMLRTFVIRFVLFVILFVLLGAAVAGAFYLNLIKRDSESNSGYSYSIGDKASTLSYGEAVRDGRVFVNFSEIAEFCDFSSIGQLDDIKYVIKGDETETIRFVTGTHTVYVNGIETRLSAESFLSKTQLFVPLDFVEAYVQGLVIEVNERTRRVKITREEIETYDENGNLLKYPEPVYEQISFLLASPDPMVGIDESVAHDLTPAPDMNFLTNLSAYEEYMNPGNTNEYMILVNRDNKLDSTYVPTDLTGIANTRDDGRDRQMMRTYPAKALEALFIEMEAAGFTDVDVTSAYRSYSYQDYLFNQRLQMMSHKGDGAYEAAAEVVMPPGSSEHQSGLCIDMHNIPTGADVSFGKTDQFKWLKENCWKFGFILRYPEDKVSITKISYEPWHYRYVGRYHAQRMYELNMCLEEYYQHLGLTASSSSAS